MRGFTLLGSSCGLDFESVLCRAASVRRIFAAFVPKVAGSAGFRCSMRGFALVVGSCGLVSESVLCRVKSVQRIAVGSSVLDLEVAGSARCRCGLCVFALVGNVDGARLRVLL